MPIDIPQIISRLATFAQQLEGPYKWYAITAVIFIITAVTTRLIFKTFKWFFFIALLGILVLGLFWALGQLSSI